MTHREKGTSRMRPDHPDRESRPGLDPERVRVLVEQYERGEDAPPPMTFEQATQVVRMLQPEPPQRLTVTPPQPTRKQR